MDITFLTATHGANLSRPAPNGTERSQSADDQGFARQLARLEDQANRAKESPRTESAPAEGEPVTEHSQNSDDQQASPLTGPAEVAALVVPMSGEQSRDPGLAPPLPTGEAPADGVDTSLAAISRRMALMDNAGQLAPFAPIISQPVISLQDPGTGPQARALPDTARLDVPGNTPHALRQPGLPTRVQQELSVTPRLERRQQGQPIAAQLTTPPPTADTPAISTMPAMPAMPAMPTIPTQADVALSTQADVAMPGPVQAGADSMFTQGFTLGFTLGNGVTAGTQPPLSPSAAVAATLSAPVATQAWQQQLGQQLVGLAMRRDQSMELHLNPIELGPLQISLKLAEQGAQAHFMSAHAPVRQAIEQAIPQLREALAEQGISLGEASVGEQDRQQAGSFAHEQPSRAASTGEPTEAGAAHSLPAEVALRPLILDGRVDLYA